jgi:hypothetical protein
MKKICASCGREFEAKRKNQKYCRPDCPKIQKMLFSGGVTKKGNTITVKGVLNCMRLFM